MEKGRWSVKTAQFEGPLELLLELIEKRKLFISDVSLSTVADDFIQYLNQLEHFPVAESAQFILVASTLLLIKSKSLLPTLALSSEEEENIHDLEKRLMLYQRIRQLSGHLKARWGKEIIFEKNQSSAIEPVFSPDASMTIPALHAAIRSVLAAMPAKEHIPAAIVRKVISLEEMIANLSDRISASLKMSFTEFSGKSRAAGGKAADPSGMREHKVHIIVSFLAMLELVKRGVLAVRQENDFGDIEMETQHVGVPRY
jgi:segregation and condensation protein A